MSDTKPKPDAEIRQQLCKLSEDVKALTEHVLLIEQLVERLMAERKGEPDQVPPEPPRRHTIHRLEEGFNLVSPRGPSSKSLPRKRKAKGSRKVIKSSGSPSTEEKKSSDSLSDGLEEPGKVGDEFRAKASSSAETRINPRHFASSSPSVSPKPPRQAASEEKKVSPKRPRGLVRSSEDNSTFTSLKDRVASKEGVIFTAKKIGTKKGEDKIAFGQFTCSEGSYVYWWAIFDGHNGSECSEFCLKNLQGLLEKNLRRSSSKLPESLVKAIKDLDSAYCKQNALSLSGTTCLLSCLIRDKLYTVNVGDSKAVHLTRACKALDQINVEQAVGTESEREKMEKLASKVGCKIIAPGESAKPDRDYYQGWFECEKGNAKRFQVMVPPKVKEKFALPNPCRAINLTSSIGDYVFGPVLQTQPEAYTTTLDVRASLLLMASEPFWSLLNLNNTEAQKILERAVSEHCPNDLLFDELEGEEIIETLEKLTELAYAKFGSQSAIRDDMSIVLIYLPECDLANKQQFFPTADDEAEGLTFMELIMKGKM